MTDESLANAYRAHVDATPAADGPPTPDELLALAEGSGDAPARLAALERALADGRTAREFGLLRAAVVSARPQAAAPPARVWTRWAPLAAAAAILVVAGLLLRRPADPAGDAILRGEATTVTLVGPAEVAAGEDVRFAWRSVAAARVYRFELYEADGRTVAAMAGPDTVAIVPGAALAPGGDYRWAVRAVLLDGRDVAAPPRRLVVRQ